MGDRTNVTLCVLKQDEGRVKAVVDDGANWEGGDDEFTEFNWDEVNYGNLDFEEELQQAGIPYDKDWGSGGEYGPGTQYCRYTADGRLVVKEVSDDDINPALDQLLKLVDTPAALCQFIQDHAEKVTPLSWDNQGEYAKVFRTIQLIKPS